MNKFLTALVAAFLLAVPASIVTPVKAHDGGDVYQSGEIIVSHLWTHATSATSDAIEVYLTIDNTGLKGDELIATTTRFTGQGRLQAPAFENGALRVVEAPTLEIAPGQTISFQQGGITLVLPNVQRVLREGDHFDIVFEFSNAGAITAEVGVEAPVGSDEPDAINDPVPDIEAES